MKVGDLVRQEREDGTVPVGAIGLVLEEDNRQKTVKRWTIKWITGNAMPDSKFRIGETTGYGYGVEVISESR